MLLVVQFSSPSKVCNPRNHLQSCSPLLDSHQEHQRNVPLFASRTAADFSHISQICGWNPQLASWPLHDLESCSRILSGVYSKAPTGPVSPGFCCWSSHPSHGAYHPNLPQHSPAPSRVSPPTNSSYRGRALAPHYPPDLLKLQTSSCSMLLLYLGYLAYFQTYTINILENMKFLLVMFRWF